MRRFDILAVVVLALVGGACALTGRPSSDAPAGGTAPVALLTEGSAFAHPELQDTAVHALERATGRRVVRLDPGSQKASRARVASRVVRAHPAVKGYDERPSSCSADAPVTIALDYDVAAVYRLALEYEQRSRPLAKQDKRGRPLDRLLGA